MTVLIFLEKKIFLTWTFINLLEIHEKTVESELIWKQKTKKITQFNAPWNERLHKYVNIALFKNVIFL